MQKLLNGSSWWLIGWTAVVYLWWTASWRVDYLNASLLTLGASANATALLFNGFRMPVSAPEVPLWAVWHKKRDESTRLAWLTDWVRTKNTYCSPGDLLIWASLASMLGTAAVRLTLIVFG